VFTWWSAPFDEVGNRLGTANFGQRGIAPIGYAVFALVLGALLGAIFRRTLPAMAATAAGFLVVRWGVQLVVRPRLIDPVSTTRPLSMYPSARPDSLALGSSTKTANAPGATSTRSRSSSAHPHVSLEGRVA
jgi:hypothetical protein